MLKISLLFLVGLTMMSFKLNALDGWRFGVDWSPNPSSITVDTIGDEFAWKTNLILGNTWSMEVRAKFLDFYNREGHEGDVGLALGGSNLNLVALAHVNSTRNGSLYHETAYWTYFWNYTTPRFWETHVATNDIKLKVERRHGENRLHFTVTSTNGYSRTHITSDIPESILSQIRRIGLRAYKVKAEFSEILISSPLPASAEISLYPGIRIFGQTGLTYTLEYSTNLNSAWVAFTNVTLQSPSLLWVDASWTNHPSRLYRIKPPE